MTPSDWQAKAIALNALVPIEIGLTIGDRWYIAQSGLGIETASSTKLGASNGASIQEAVESHWARYVDNLTPEEYLTFRDDDGDRTNPVRWNGFMWASVPAAARHPRHRDSP